MLELMASDYMEREVFCCGPEPFMQTVRDILNAAGFDMTHYHEESFQAPIRVEEQIPEHDDVMPEAGAAAIIDRKSVVSGKRGSVRVELGGRRFINKNKEKTQKGKRTTI